MRRYQSSSRASAATPNNLRLAVPHLNYEYLGPEGHPMPEKRTAKKAAKKGAPGRVHSSVADLQRAYQHLGRIEILEGALAGAEFVHVSTLNQLAQQQLIDGYTRNAADLLHASEHICFASLAPNRATVTLVSLELKRTIAGEFEQLMRRSEEQWAKEDTPGQRAILQEIFTRALIQARGAFERADYRRALEFARAAEALSNIGKGLPSSMPDSGLLGRLAS